MTILTWNLKGYIGWVGQGGVRVKIRKLQAKSIPKQKPRQDRAS